MKKSVSFILIFTLLLSFTGIASGEEINNNKNISKSEINTLVNEMNKVAQDNSSKINFLEEGLYEWQVTTKDNLTGTVTVKVEKLDNANGDISTRGEFDVSDGDYTHTIEYDIHVGGYVKLKTSYTVHDSATKAYATDAEAHAGAPVGYVVSYKDADYTNNIPIWFSSHGDYTFSLGQLNISYEIKVDFNVGNGTIYTIPELSL